jgi:hypothetical protein
MKVTTNHKKRPIIEAYELTAREREEFDYLDWPAIDDGRDSASFVRYRGQLYILSDFSADYGITKGAGLPDSLTGWDGYLTDSFFSAVVIRYVDDYEYVVMGKVTT